jgi:hypothetical protein
VSAKPKQPFLFETVIQFANFSRRVANLPLHSSVGVTVRSDLGPVSVGDRPGHDGHDRRDDQPNASVPLTTSCGPSKRQFGGVDASQWPCSRLRLAMRITARSCRLLSVNTAARAWARSRRPQSRRRSNTNCRSSPRRPGSPAHIGPETAAGLPASWGSRCSRTSRPSGRATDARV